jgi:hypothetical protein
VGLGLLKQIPPASFSTPSVYLHLGRPRSRWPPGFVHNVFLGNPLSSIRATWPAHLNLLYFITLTIFGSVQSCSNSLLYLSPHCPFSHFAPYVPRRIFFSKTLSLLSSFFVTVHDDGRLTWKECQRKGCEKGVWECPRKENVCWKAKKIDG